MKARLVPVLLLLAACAARDPPPLEPRAHAPAEIPQLATELSSNLRFGIAGLAFAGDSLYAATNLGLLEVRDRQVKALHRWRASDNVVDALWADPARGGFLAIFRHAGFVRGGAGDWQRIPPPTPPKGYYTRGEVLEGFHPSNSSQLRLAGGGGLWRWDDAAAGWIAEPAPPRDKDFEFHAVGALGERTVYLTRNSTCIIGRTCLYRASWGEPGAWGEAQPLPPMRRILQVVSASGGVYLRGEDGALYRLDRGGATRMETPGPCEAVTRTSAGRLLASFTGAGIFVLEREWLKRFDSPHPPSEGEHWAYLAESDGRIAYATASTPTYDRREKPPRTIYVGSNGLWVSHEGKLVRVEFANP